MSVNTERITLYSAVNSPFPRRVAIALEEIGVSYDVIDLNLVEKPDWYQEKHPSPHTHPHHPTQVPCLVYGGPKLSPDQAPSPDAVKLIESVVILEFLAEVFPSAGLLPAPPKTRAHVRLFIATADAHFRPCLFGVVSGGPAAPLVAMLEELQAFLPADSGFVAGQWSIAEAAFLPLLLTLRVVLSIPPPASAPAEIAAFFAALDGDRLARLRKYEEDLMARKSTRTVWNEASATRVHGDAC
ncbi:uncharacterized protein BXZ73DRAFT_47733 [Epithele typhae]|uniref:uncharacterized protein n=1 Tax=Epithele typhae TaxID=378194 RepID=UPI002008B493|nr:uncharacterized protein BXZ73DRAFT_47733 [Epithele typhae]KAH9930458.1 hypothetical protein BXZ73DRAFT_47733 [Epithele typhae]